MDSIKFKFPATFVFFGPTFSGKTHLVRDILSHHKESMKTRKNVINVCWCHGQSQKLHYEKLPNVNIIYKEELVDDSFLLRNKIDVIVFDDLMNQIGNSLHLTDFFTKKSHHLSISVIYIVQNIFNKNKQMRTISLNANYLICMKNPRDQLQLQTLARQIMPNETKFFMQCYADATNKPYSNFIIDLHPLTPDELRLKSWKKVKDERVFVVYKLKNVSM